MNVREIRPFRQVTELLNLPEISPVAEHLKRLVAINSGYFLITAQGDFAGARKRIYATFRRNQNATQFLMNWHED